MKRKSILGILAAAAMLTACGEKPAENAQTTAAASVQTTAAITTESAATTAEISSATGETTSSSAETTAVTGSTAATQFTAQTTTAANTQTTAAKSAVTTAASSAKPVQNASGVIREIKLNAEQQSLVDRFADGVVKKKSDVFKTICNTEDYLFIYRMFEPDAADYALQETLASLTNDGFVSAKIEYCAERPDMMAQLADFIERGKREMQEESPAEREKYQKAMDFLATITDYCTAEGRFTDTEGETFYEAIPMYCRDGKWMIDLFLYDEIEAPITREECCEMVTEQIEEVLLAIRDMLKQKGVWDENAEIECIWDSKDIANAAKPDAQHEKDLQANLLYYLHENSPVFNSLRSMRIYFGKNDWAFAVEDEYGRVGYYPLTAQADEENQQRYTNAEQAYAYAKEIVRAMKDRHDSDGGIMQFRF